MRGRRIGGRGPLDDDGALRHDGDTAMTDRLGGVGATPSATLAEVNRLAIPGTRVEIEVEAGR